MQTEQMTAPLFRDPIYDGATDPVVIWNREENCWFMFYTQRRSTAPQIGVASIHGSKIGVAYSADGKRFIYRGTLDNLDIEPGHNTFWAPEIIYAAGEYHMYVSYITGILTDWNAGRKMLHYTADNLWQWKFQGEVALSSDRVIDACIYEVEPNVWKMWYKDEKKDSRTWAAVSQDLYHWEVVGEEISDCAHEGPNVFELGGKKWMITDFWNGLGVYRTDDYTTWERCEKNLLDDSGIRTLDQGLGHHADVVVKGERAFIFYFVHPFMGTEKEALAVVQAAEITTDGENLYCDRNRAYCGIEE